MMGGAEFLGLFAVMSLFGLLSLGLQVWALVDAARRPEWELERSGGKMLWVILLAVGLVVPGFGLLLAVVYLLAIRPRTPLPR